MLVPTTCFNCESACGLLAYVDPETLEIRKFEGNPEHPGSRGRNCAKGPGNAEPGQRPRQDPLSAAQGRRPRRGTLGARLLGRGPGRSRRPHPARDRRRSGQRGDVSRRPARRGRLRRAGPGGLGRRRPQLAHERLLELGPSRLSLLDGARPPEPRPREREGHPPHQRPPRVGPLLQPARPACDRRQGERREADRLRHAALQHRDARRLVDRAACRARRRRSCSRSPAT